MAQEIKVLTNGEVRSLPPDGLQWLPADRVWIEGEQLKAWRARITTTPTNDPSIHLPPSATLPTTTEVSLYTLA